MRVLLFGFLIGLLAPIIGIFVYLQLSSVVGDILLMPVYMLAGIFDEPFWYLTLGQKFVLFSICGAFYSFFLGVLQVSPNTND